MAYPKNDILEMNAGLNEIEGNPYHMMEQQAK